MNMEIRRSNSPIRCCARNKSSVMNNSHLRQSNYYQAEKESYPALVPDLNLKHVRSSTQNMSQYKPRIDS